MPQIGVPTLVVFGTEDRVIPPEMGRVYRANMPNCSLAFMYDAGHAIAADRPESAAELVGDFLERHELFVVARDSSVVNP
jgi:pimeloyl-ACP methyl ester carboxylesterase